MARRAFFTAGLTIAGAFDGRHVYLLPAGASGSLVRFDAKSPPSMPLGYGSSFS